jgi:hypothetical protein
MHTYIPGSGWIAVKGCSLKQEFSNEWRFWRILGRIPLRLLSLDLSVWL